MYQYCRVLPEQPLRIHIYVCVHILPHAYTHTRAYFYTSCPWKHKISLTDKYTEQVLLLSVSVYSTLYLNHVFNLLTSTQPCQREVRYIVLQILVTSCFVTIYAPHVSPCYHINRLLKFHLPASTPNTWSGFSLCGPGTLTWTQSPFDSICSQRI